MEVSRGNANGQSWNMMPDIDWNFLFPCRLHRIKDMLCKDPYLVDYDP